MSNSLKKNSDFLLDYVSLAPLALAFERVLECRLLSEQNFERPVLDIGCGEGLFAKVLFADKIETGIDPNAQELARARELGGYEELLECCGDAIPKPDGSYRTILSNSVVEHIPDILPVLKEAHRLLAPGGRLYLTVPTNRFDEYSWISQLLLLLGMKGLQQRFSQSFNRFWAHYHFYNQDGWVRLADQAGFDVIEAREYGPKRACLLNDFLVPFSVPEFLTKKLANRWTMLPGLRRIILASPAAIGDLFLRGGQHCDDGGLIFLSLKKAG